MAITYPLSMPTSPGFRKVVFSPEAVVSMSVSPFTGSQQLYQHPGQWWEVGLSLPPMQRAEAEEWISFLLRLNGRWGTFLLGDPAGATARGVATGPPLVNGGSQTGNSLITDGWTPSIVNILRAGDYIQLGSGANAELYKVSSDVNSDSGGNATLDIWPNLRNSPTDGEAIVVSNTKGLFRLPDNEMSWDIASAIIYGIEFAAIEAI